MKMCWERVFCPLHPLHSTLRTPSGANCARLANLGAGRQCSPASICHCLAVLYWAAHQSAEYSPLLEVVHLGESVAVRLHSHPPPGKSSQHLSAHLYSPALLPCPLLIISKHKTWLRLPSWHTSIVLLFSIAFHLGYILT